MGASLSINVLMAPNINRRVHARLPGLAESYSVVPLTLLNHRAHYLMDSELHTGMRRINFVSCFRALPLPLDQRCAKICLDVKADVSNRKKDSQPASRDSRSAKERAKATHVWLVLWKASHAVEQNARASVAKLELGLTDFAVLEMLLHKGPQPVNTIGRRVLLTSGSITTAIDRLESRDLVYRTGHPEDRRTRMVHLTEEGRRVIERAFQLHARDMEEMAKVLNSQERIELVRLLKKLGRYAEAKAQ